MSHTNETANYELPQFVGSDKPTWLGDVNGAMLKIDNAIAGVASDTAGAVSVANGAATLAQSASDAASAATTTAESASTAASTATSTANTAADTANNAQSTAVLAKNTADTAATNASTALAAAVRGSVYVDADGVKTVGQLLNELYALIDSTKVTHVSDLVLTTEAGSDIVFKAEAITSTNYFFTRTRVVANTEIESCIINANSSSNKNMRIASDGTVTVTDDTSTVLVVGNRYALNY